MTKIDEMLASLGEGASSVVDADGVVSLAMARIDGAPSPHAMAQAARRQIAGVCLGAAILVGGGGGLVVGAGRLDDSPLSPKYALSPASLFQGG
jgi:hypothetical protein